MKLLRTLTRGRAHRTGLAARLRTAALVAGCAIFFHGTASAVGTVVLAGGGPEGDIGQTHAWS